MNVLIITGERSAENYASLLVDELNKLGSFNFFSICSDILDKKTTKIGDYRDISIIGAREAFGILKKAINLLGKAKKTIKEKNIELVILLDFPEFNLKIARFAKKNKAKVVYYITPQVWAWRRYRIKKLNQYTNLTLPILPFERLFFKSNGLKNAKFFGHPIVDILHNRVGIHKKENIILLMPGSRKSEIEFNYKPMFEAAKLIHEKYPHFDFVWIFPQHLSMTLANKLKKGYDFIKIKHNPYKFMDKAFYGILKSGTTTLEASLFGLPMTVVYRLSKLSYRMGKILIKNIKYISLPNLILNREVVKELIEDEATAESIFEDFERIHLNAQIRKNMRSELLSLWQILGDYPITPKIAKEIAKLT
ncbi:lipid-A-disaccharide synthase [Hippea maritima]|uniref:Lipid-A-disaccharide synthase n=1 Tax=Hippea maritima (strain ATCC 700847 / DSM 10411 / MH2) TaxID=760142 RepID=F2LXE0_HIPMA|nr:lipid-A-disaccharide synthase [Hippea maritima]AEA34254.1 lipid-A-disaccharide synthase [Hippea maritima DSM 10411]